MKKLAEHAPETPETALLLRRGSCACGCRHTSILAQNVADGRGDTARSRPTGATKPERRYCERIGDNGTKPYCIPRYVGLEWQKK
jgi:hypothetical protein